MLLALAWVIVASSQSPDPQVDHWPSGAPKFECGRALVKGREVLEGDSRSWFENGQLEAEGRYHHGERVGSWKHYWPNGTVRARGRYTGDRRQGKWFFYDSNGAENAQLTGEQRFDRLEHPNGALSREGYFVDDTRQGEWSYYWPDGSLQCAGAFRYGRREGEWVFYGLDGQPAESFVTGEYVDGQRTRPLAAQRIAELSAMAVGGDARRVRARSSLSDALLGAAGDVERLRDVFGAALREDPESAARALLSLDPAEAAQLAVLEALFPVLNRFVGGHAFEPTAPNSADAAAQRARSWSALLALTAHDPFYRNWDFRVSHPGAAPNALICTGPCAAITSPALRSDERPYRGATMRRRPAFALRFASPSKDPKSTAFRDAQHSALAWLAAHQEANGSWDAVEFSGHCTASPACDGPGESVHNVGLTALVLLAFLANGESMTAGEFAPNIERGARWLLEQQDPDSGLFGEPSYFARAYGHSIATLAIAEAYGGFEHPLLERSLQAAMDFLAKSQMPYSGWAYFSPKEIQELQPDSSVTYWAAVALWTGREFGMTVEGQVLTNARSFVAQVTDSVTGRTGYNSMGSASSRVVRLNDHFFAERNEGLTGAGIALRVLLRDGDASDPMIAKGLSLIREKAPMWNPDEHGIDAYSWFHESTAMALVGDAKQQASWSAALRAALVDSQRRDGHALGSWDAQHDAWGFAGGRVYTTALGALALSAPWRYDAAHFVGARRAK